MRNLYKWGLMLVCSISLASCVDKYESGTSYPQPKDDAMNAYLASYQVLKSYVDYSANPNFNLTLAVDPADYMQKEVTYSMVCSNFNAVETADGMTYGSMVKADGIPDYSTVKNLVTTAKDGQTALLGGPLCWHRQQNKSYLEQLVADIFIPGDKKSGKTVIFDFENDALGTIYFMTNGSTSTVENDPSGESGKVLHVGGDVKASYSYPKFDVTLPEGITLGDCTTLIMDFKGKGSSGLYGSGMRLSIDGVEATFGSPYSMGCQENKWGRGLIAMEISKIALTEEQKKLTSFSIYTGSGTGSGDYYIDNITMRWEVGTSEDQTIIKTPEEKEKIFSDTLNYWIKGLMQAAAGNIKVWDVVKDPMSDKADYMLRSAATDTDTTGCFYWQDFLGGNYVRKVAGYARKAYQEAGGTDGLKLFVSEYGLEKEDGNKCDRLLKMINQWEEDGTKIDGITVQLPLQYSLSPDTQSQNEAAIEAMFKKLADSGKNIRVAGLTMTAVDEFGTDIPSNEWSVSQQFVMAEYYNWVIRKYMELIPADRRYGISFASSSVLWNKNHNRQPAYIGIADGVAGKETINTAKSTH